MCKEEVQKTMEEAREELLDKIRSCYASKSGWNTARAYLSGLMSGAERKNGWQMSEQIGECTPYRLQQFLYRGAWDANKVRDRLRDYVSEHLGSRDGVLIVDETGFVKQGKFSVGVKRHYSGTAGRVENCQIGVFLAYASEKGHTLMDRQLYLPQEWTENRDRCEKAGVPEEISFQTKPELALSMIRSTEEAGIPFSWVTGDSVYGDPGNIRTYLESTGKQYVMAVSGKVYLWIGMRQLRVSEVIQTLPEEGWQRVSTGAGSKGEKYFDWFWLPLHGAEKGFKRYFMVRRSISHPEKVRGYLCCCREGTPLSELVRVAGVRWSVEMSFSETKGEVGLDHYEVRSWQGWYGHITMAMCAHALLAVLKIRLKDVIEGCVASKEGEENFSAFKKGRNLQLQSAKQN